MVCMHSDILATAHCPKELSLPKLLSCFINGQEVAKVAIGSVQQARSDGNTAKGKGTGKGKRFAKDKRGNGKRDAK